MLKTLAITATVTLSLLFVIACGNTNSPASAGPHGIVTLHAGTRYSGNLVKSSTSEITFTLDDNTSRTFDMKDVKSVEYGEPAAVQAGTPNSPSPRTNRPEHETVLTSRYHPVESVITSKTNALPAGTEIAVRTDETIDSNKGAEGQVYAAEIAKDILDSQGDLVIPKGSNAQIVIRSASKGGHFSGNSDLLLDLTSVTVDGRLYKLDTADLEQRGRDGFGKNKRTAEYVGTGAAVGAIIGAIAGHGKGAAIGAGSGAAAGIATEVLTRGSAVRVPAESLLTFRLDKALRVYPLR